MEVTGTTQHDAWQRKQMPPVERLRPDLWSIPVPIPNNPLRYVSVYAFALVGEYLLRNSRSGWQLRAMGSDQESARRIGVRIDRTFIAGSHDVALEFAANIGKWQLKGIDLIKFNDAGEMIEFEVMVRPIKALAALGEEMGNRIGPELSRLKRLAGAPG